MTVVDGRAGPPTPSVRGTTRVVAATGGGFELEVSAVLAHGRGCPLVPSLELAPGDSAVLTRVLRSESLAGFAPGTYGVNVAVTTPRYLIGTWAGAIRLPLTGAP